jgi:hypothetical protein
MHELALKCQILHEEMFVTLWSFCLFLKVKTFLKFCFVTLHADWRQEHFYKSAETELGYEHTVLIMTLTQATYSTYHHCWVRQETQPRCSQQKGLNPIMTPRLTSSKTKLHVFAFNIWVSWEWMTHTGRVERRTETCSGASAGVMICLLDGIWKPAAMDCNVGSTYQKVD